MPTDVEISFGGRFDDLKASLNDMEGYMRGWGDNIKRIGVGAFAAWGILQLRNNFLMLSAAGESVVENMTRLESVLNATGHAAGFTLDQLEDLASEMQSLTKFEDEVFIKAEAIVAAFKNVRGDEFERVIRLSADFAQIMGGDVASAAWTLGRALDAPTQGMVMLRRQGIRFTEEQQDLINALVDSNDILGAQKVILDEVTAKYGGAAKAAADAAGGGFAQIENMLNDIYETAGVVLVTALDPLIDILKVIAQAAKDWADQFKDSGKDVADAVVVTVEEVVGWFNMMYTYVTGVFDALSDLWVDVFGMTYQQSLGLAWESFKSTFTAILRFGVGVLTAIQVMWNEFPTVAEMVFVQAQLSAVTFFEEVKYFLTEVIPSLLTWFFENWKEIFTDIFNFTTTVFKNMWENVKNFFIGVWDWLNGGDFDFEWTALTDGFESSLKALPEIAGRELSELEVQLMARQAKLGNQLSSAFSEQYKKNLRALGLETEGPEFKKIEREEKDKGKMKDPGERENYAKRDGGGAQFEGLQELFKRIQQSAATMTPAEQRDVKKLEAAEGTKIAAERTAKATEKMSETLSRTKFTVAGASTPVYGP